MTFRIFKRTVSAAAAAMCFMAAVPAVPLSASAESHKLISYEGYDYEYWADSDESTVTFDIDKKGGFDASWNAYGNCFMSKGLIEQAPASNNYKIDYDLSINFGPVQNATAENACTYVCAYGFLKQPTAEFFFTDYDSDISRYENTEYFTPMGSVDIDGKTYDLYSQKVSMHTINGAVSYTRYFSVRRGGEMKDRYELGQSWGSETEYSDYSGEIDIGAQFDALEKLGEKIGDLDRVSLNVESYRSSGEVKLKSCDFTEYTPANSGIQTKGTFEKNGGTYTYTSSCRPSKVDMKVNTVTDDKEFDYKWQGGSNTITKTFFNEPVMIGANDLILFKEDYSFELNGDDSSDNSFSGILEMELNDSQKLCLVDTGTDISQEKISSYYKEKGIVPTVKNTASPAQTITLSGALYDTEKQIMSIYPFTYMFKDGNKEYTDYWVTIYPNDIYSYNENKREFSGNKILPDHSYRSYNIIKIADLLKDLREYGLDADTVYSASYTLSSENYSGSLSVNALKLDISRFNSGGYDFSPEYYGENNFDIDSNKNGLFDFSWNNTKYGACTAMAEKHFDGSGLDLSKVKSIVADYSVTVDSVQVYGVKNDNTAVYLRGKLPLSDGARSEFYIDLAYLGNNADLKKQVKLIPSAFSLKDNDKEYELYFNPNDYPSGFCVSGFVSDINELVHQYWSLEHEPPVNGEAPASFSGSVDITKHIAKYKATGDRDAFGILSDLALCAEAYRSVGTVSVDKFDITVTYNDGTVMKYTPSGAAAPEKDFLKGDINGDDVFSISDVVTLQQWLIGSRNVWVKNLEAADLNGDGSIDIFDLCEMRKAVLQKITFPVAVSINVRGGYAGVDREWKVYREDDKFILYFKNIKNSTDAPFTAEITEEEYRQIMSQDYEVNIAPPLVMDGFYYDSVITYKDGTEKNTQSDMSEAVWIMDKLLSKYKYNENL